MKKNKRLSLQLKIYLLVIVSVLATTSVLTFISTQSITKDKKAYIYDFIYSNTEVTSIIIGQFIDESVQSVKSTLEQVEDIKTEEDSETVIEPAFINNPDLYEFAVVNINKENKLERIFTRYSYRHFSKLSEVFHMLLKIDTEDFEEHVRKTNPNEKNVDILFSKGSAPRLVYAIKSKSIEEDKIFVFKFSLQRILEKAFSSDTFEYALAKNDGRIVISSKNEILNGNINDFSTKKSNLDFKTKAVSNTLVKEVMQDINGNLSKIILGIHKINSVDTFLTTGMKSSRAFRVTNVIVTKVILIFFIILAICSIIAFFLSKAITRPLNKLVGATEIIAAGQFEHRVEVSAGDELQALSHSFNLMIDKINEYNEKLLEANLFLEDKVKARTAELQSANDFTKAVLESIDQGLFVFNKNGKILDVNNKRCREIWLQDITDMNMSELFTDTDPDVIRMWLKNLFEERLEFESIIRLGPTTLDFEDRDSLANIEISYFPMRNKKGKIQNVIGIASDRTEKVEFEKQMEINTAKVNSILSITSQKAEYQSYVLETIDSFNSLKKLFNKPGADPHSVSTEVMRHFHSIKGNSSVFSLKAISSTAHECENQIQDKHKSGEAISIPEMQAISERLEKVFYDSLKEYQKVSGLKLDSLNERTVELKLSILLKFLKYLRELKQEPIIQKYSSLFLRRPASEVFGRYREAVDEISNSLNRKVNRFDITGHETAIHKFFYQKFFNELIHVFRNIADHANQQPEERVAAGKAEGISIDINVSLLVGEDQPLLKIEIQDDGKGIDPAIVRDRLEKNGADPAILQKDDTAIIEHIFDPSFSTAQTVSVYSGRGVGLSAVKFAVEEMKGRYMVKSAVNIGTTFTFILPYA